MIAPTPLSQRDVIRWGIIGCGDVTEVKSGPGFQKAARSSLVAVMRRNGDLAADYAHRHGVPRWYNDARALVNDPEVDAVYIATPPASTSKGLPSLRLPANLATSKNQWRVTHQSATR